MEDLRVIRPGHRHAGRRQRRVRRLVDRSPAVVVVEEDPDPNAPLVVRDQNLLRRRVRQLVHRHVETLSGRGHEVVEGRHPGLRLDQQRQRGRRSGGRWSRWWVWAVVFVGAEQAWTRSCWSHFVLPVAPLRREAVGVEQPSAESATPTNTVSTQTANHFFMCDRSELSTARQRVPVTETEISLRVGRPRHRRHWHSAPACR
jgi:hypothetical protein